MACAQQAFAHSYCADLASLCQCLLSTTCQPLLQLSCFPMSRETTQPELEADQQKYQYSRFTGNNIVLQDLKSKSMEILRDRASHQGCYLAPCAVKRQILQRTHIGAWFLVMTSRNGTGAQSLLYCLVHSMHAMFACQNDRVVRLHHAR
jgi:hypothetical protein